MENDKISEFYKSARDLLKLRSNYNILTIKTPENHENYLRYGPLSEQDRNVDLYYFGLDDSRMGSIPIRSILSCPLTIRIDLIPLTLLMIKEMNCLYFKRVKEAKEMIEKLDSHNYLSMIPNDLEDLKNLLD